MSNLVNSFAMGYVTVAVESGRTPRATLPLFGVFPSQLLGNLLEEEAKSKQLFFGFAITNFLSVGDI